MTIQLGPLTTGPELAAGARSYVYGLLGASFGFPAPDFASLISSGQWAQDVGALARHLPFELTVAEAVALSAPVGQAELEQAYIQLFEVGPGQPFCPLYEGSHRHGRMKIMEEVVRFYEHFGLQPRAGDQPDHLCAELEFMHYLAFKECAALGHGGQAQGLPEAQMDFLSRHLCRWLPRLHQRLTAAREPSAFFEALASLAMRFCTSDRAWLRSVRKSLTRQSGPCPTDGAEGSQG